MAKKKKGKRKVRANFRKKHESRTRDHDLTRKFQSDSKDELDQLQSGERVSGRSRLSRKRTIVGAEVESENETGFQVQLDVDLDVCRKGRVLAVRGLNSEVEDADGKVYLCAIRGILKSLATDLQNVVVAGDEVMFEPIDETHGVIARVEPRNNCLSRTSRSRQHVIVSNVDQILIMASAAEPGLKPNLVDRFLISAEKANIEALICINKIDLVPASDLQPVVGVWGQLGYRVLLVSAKENIGIDHLRSLLKDKDSVVCGQSGVGKSSLLNAVQPELNLRVSHVSAENQKGRHTTTAAELVRLEFGGHIVDTPGIRQFQLWDVEAEEVEGYFRDIRPFIDDCKYPDCTHTHEEVCAVKDAVADNKLDVRRYESYFKIREGD